MSVTSADPQGSIFGPLRLFYLLTMFGAFVKLGYDIICIDWNCL